MMQFLDTNCLAWCITQLKSKNAPLKVLVSYNDRMCGVNVDLTAITNDNDPFRVHLVAAFTDFIEAMIWVNMNLHINEDDVTVKKYCLKGKTMYTTVKYGKAIPIDELPL